MKARIVDFDTNGIAESQECFCKKGEGLRHWHRDVEEASRTQTPLIASENCLGDIIDVTGNLVARCIRLEDVPQIVLAVNAHEELLRAMRKAVKDIEYAMDCKTFAPSSGIPMENAKVVLELAIAKAEGK